MKKIISLLCAVVLSFPLANRITFLFERPVGYIPVLAAKKVIKTPFIVINADDYYGKEGFKAVHEYLVNGGKSCMAGFVLKNTLSDNGGVTRGICKMDGENNLTRLWRPRTL